jgi:hypothetical protein
VIMVSGALEGTSTFVYAPLNFLTLKGMFANPTNRQYNPFAPLILFATEDLIRIWKII